MNAKKDITDRKKIPWYIKGRMWLQALFFVITNGYVAGFLNAKIYKGQLKRICVPGLNCYSCPGAMGACPIGALQSVISSAEYKFSCYIFGFFLVVGTLLGRGVCGFLCPFGWVQDLLYKIPLGKKKDGTKRKNLPGHKVLIWLKYAVLLGLVLLLPMLVKTEYGAGIPWFCKYLCPSGTLFGAVPLLSGDEFLRQSLGFLFGWKCFVLVVLLFLSVLFYRPFCKYLCPLGAAYGLFNSFSLFRVQVEQESCISCGKCHQTCPMDVDITKHPGSPECIRCGICVKECPTGALFLGAKGRGEKKE